MMLVVTLEQLFRAGPTGTWSITALRENPI